MGFPKSVNTYPANGIPGAFASTNPVVSTPKGYIAGVDLTIGAFCWEDTSNPGEVKNTGTGAPLGFVCREFTNPIYSNAEDQNFVPAGCNASIMVSGDFYASVSESVTAGQKVFASLTDGTLKGAAAGSNESGYMETPFTFLESVTSSGITIISTNYIQAITPNA